MPGIGSTIYEREQVKKERERKREVMGRGEGELAGVENREEKRSAKET